MCIDQYSSALDADNVNTFYVDGICHFYAYEKRTIPYRWTYEISDESVAQFFYSEYIDDTKMWAKDGGDDGYRRIFFKAIAPGECVISLRHENLRDGNYLNEFTYNVVVKSLGAGTPLQDV